MEDFSFWYLILAVFAYLFFTAKTMKKAKGEPKPTIEIEWPGHISGTVSLHGQKIFEFDKDRRLIQPHEGELLQKSYEGTKGNLKHEYLIRVPDDAFEKSEALDFEIECTDVSKPGHPEIEPTIAWIHEGQVDFKIELAEKSIEIPSAGTYTLRFDTHKQRYDDNMAKWAKIKAGRKRAV